MVPHALFIGLVVLPVVYLLSMVWAWVRRSAVRAKTRSGCAGLFSLWFPLLTTLVAAWVLVPWCRTCSAPRWARCACSRPTSCWSCRDGGDRCAVGGVPARGGLRRQVRSCVACASGRRRRDLARPPPAPEPAAWWVGQGGRPAGLEVDRALRRGVRRVPVGPVARGPAPWWRLRRPRRRRPPSRPRPPPRSPAPRAAGPGAPPRVRSAVRAPSRCCAPRGGPAPGRRERGRGLRRGLVPGGTEPRAGDGVAVCVLVGLGHVVMVTSDDVVFPGFGGPHRHGPSGCPTPRSR